MIGEIFRERDRAFEPGDNPLSAIRSRYAAALGTGKNPLTALADKYNSVMSPSRVPANIRGPGGSANPIRRGVPKSEARYSPWEDGMFSFSPLDAKPEQTIRPKENAKGELSARVAGQHAEKRNTQPRVTVTRVDTPAPRAYSPDKNGVPTNTPEINKIQFTAEAHKELESRKPMGDARTQVWTPAASRLISVPGRQMGVQHSTPTNSPPSRIIVTPPADQPIKVTKVAAYPWAADAARAAGDPALTMGGDLKGYLSDSAVGRGALRRQTIAHPQGSLANRMNSIFGQGLSIANKSADRTVGKLQDMSSPPESMGLKPYNPTPISAAANSMALNANMNAKKGIAVKPALSASAPPKIAPGPSLDIPSIGSTLSAFKQRPLPIAKPAPVPRVPNAPRV